MASYGKTSAKYRSLAAIAAAAAIVAMIAGCNSGNSGGQSDAPGYNPGYPAAQVQAQDEQNGAIGAQGPGITSNGDNDAGTGGEYDGSGG
jgi:hypothetical protein